MALKRKTQEAFGNDDGDDDDGKECRGARGIAHPVLSLTFRKVVSLADFLLESLDGKFSSQRGRIQELMRCDFGESQDGVADILRGVLVGMDAPRDGESCDGSGKQLRSKDHRSVPPIAAKRKTDMPQILDNVVAALLRRPPSSSHILAQNLQGRSTSLPPANRQLALLKSYPWTELPSLLGQNARSILTDLLLNFSVFLPGENGALYQISGVPLPDIPTTSSPLHPITPFHVVPLNRPKEAPSENIRAPNSIIFVRRRMFYARAALNRRGDVRLGLRHIHVLNRYPEPDNPLQTLHILKHIFPRAFKLHNVFTSAIDRRKTTSQLVDYSMRETEIKGQLSALGEKKANKVPKRLRSAVPLVARLQRLHRRCAYKELLDHYCPVPTLQPFSIQQGQNAMTVHETPPAAVSVFARSVLTNILPRDFLGAADEHGDANRDALMRHVNNFVHLRRFEKLSLHQVTQGIKVTSIPWLRLPGGQASRTVSASDLEARRSLLSELLYYIFDSILIPLLRTNFYITESSAHRNRIFYFRHDVWRRLAEPHLSRLKSTLFNEVPRENALAILRRRTLGFNLLRLLPKSHGARPIMNLRRRPMVLKRGGQEELGPSINTIMKPAFDVLDYERRQRPALFGVAAMGGVNDLHARVKAFAQRLAAAKNRKQEESTSASPGDDRGAKLYFVKLDIQSCFDTIPHEKLLGLLGSLFSENRYRISRHVEMRPSEAGSLKNTHNKTQKAGSAWPRRDFVTRASSTADVSALHERSKSRIKKPRNAVLVPLGNHRFQSARDIFHLLREHVQNNLVRIGKKFYKQRSGIPQGSVVSSLLCNFFYAAHEKEHLSFITDRKNDALLLRLVDDYLLITTDKSLAARFLQVMVTGSADYCINVNPNKSLVNFPITVNSHKIPRLEGSYKFPYCGTLIDTNTLAFTKDRSNMSAGARWHTDAADNAPADALTVETSREPGHAFSRKTITTWKMTAASQPMFLDAQHTAPREVLRGLYAAFVDAANKMTTYIRSLKRQRIRKLPRGGGITDAVLLRTIKVLITCSIRSAARANRRQMVGGLLDAKNIRYLASMALSGVLGRGRQARLEFEGTLRWLGSLRWASRPGTNVMAREMRRIMRPVVTSPWRF